jgi:hypothetical protein
MSRQIKMVTVKVNIVNCRLCGGSGRDPYSYGQSCRKCGGHKRMATPAGARAKEAAAKWVSALLADREDGPTQDDFASYIDYINGLRGATAVVTYYTDEEWEAVNAA